MKTEAKATPLRKPRLGSSDSEEEGEGEEGSFEVRRGAARDSGVEARRGERGVDAIRVQREREMGWLERLQRVPACFLIHWEILNAHHSFTYEHQQIHLLLCEHHIILKY